MKKQDSTKGGSGFRTHIPEPRWQQIASIALVLLLVALELWFFFIRR